MKDNIMKYSYFDDIAALLVELCQPFNDNELLDLMNISKAVHKNEQFAQKYTTAIKSLYVKNFQDLKNNTYKPVPFTNINNNIMQKIQNNKTEAVLLPSYTNTDKQNNPTEINALRARILKIKQSDK